MKSRALAVWLVFFFVSAGLGGEVFSASGYLKEEGPLRVKAPAESYSEISPVNFPPIRENPDIDIGYVYWGDLEPFGVSNNPTGLLADEAEQEGAVVYHRIDAGKFSGGGEVISSTMVSDDEIFQGTYTLVDPVSFHMPPLKINPGGSRTLTLRLTNVGNVDLPYIAVPNDPQGCIAGSYSGIIPTTESIDLTFTVNGTGICSYKFLQGGISIVFCENPEVFIPVHAIVADDYYECPIDPLTYDTIENTVDNMLLYANANSLEWMEDLSIVDTDLQRVFYRGGSFVATRIGLDTIVGRWYSTEDARSAARDRLYYDYCIDLDYDFHIFYTKNIFIFGPPDPPEYILYNTWWWWEWSKQIIICEIPDNRKIVINYIRVKRHDPPSWWPNQPVYAGHEDTYIGMMMDFDCPYDTLNGSEEKAPNWGGYDKFNQIAWQQGFYNPDDPEGHPEYDNYYCGMALASTYGPDPLTPYGAHVIENNQYLYPNGGWGWNDQEFYDLAATAGTSVADIHSALDRSVVMTAKHIPAGSEPNADHSFVMVEVATSNGFADMQALVDTARAFVLRWRFALPVLCGDAKNDLKVDLSDVLYILHVLFKSGPPIRCPINRGDIKPDGKIDISDVIYLLYYFFRGGPAPNCPGMY